MLHRALDTDLMRTFAYVAQERSFTAAAERLHLTQQAVSAQVKRLEGLIGHQLVLRSAQDARLTREGETLLVYARQVVDLTERVRLQFSEVPLEGSVRFGFTPGFGLSKLFPLLTTIREMHPRLELHCEADRSSSLVQKLEAGTLDVVVGAQRDGDRRGEILVRDRLMWVGASERLVRVGAPVPLALLPPPTFLRDEIFELLNRAGLRWTILFESGEASTLRAAILSGWGMSVFNAMTIADDPMLAGTAAAILPDPGFVELFLRYDDRRSPVIASFAAILRTILGDQKTAKQVVGDPASLLSL